MNQQQTSQQQNQLPVPPQPPEPKYKFRWSIFLGVPLAALFFFWLLNGVEASFSFESIMERLHVIQQHKYARLACLGVVLVAATIIVKTLKNHSD
jgi:hypothetical protein